MTGLIDLLETPEAYTVEEGYRVLIDSHVPYFRASSKTTTQSVEPLYGEKYTGDFYGLLDYLAVSKKFRYLVLRMNDIPSSDAYDGTQLTFLIPDASEANRVLDVYTSLES